MSASVQFRPHNRDFGMVMREVDEDLAIFLGIRNGDNPNNSHLNVEITDKFDDSKGEDLISNASLKSKAPHPEAVQITDKDDSFIKLENDRSDFDWLLTQADTSLLPSSVKDSVTTQMDISKADGNSLESKQAKSTTTESSTAANKWPLSSGNRKPTTRASTPTSRVAMPVKPKPTSGATMPSKPVAAQPRSSTPAKTTLHSSTPTRKPVSAPNQSSSVKKTSTTMLKNPLPSSITSSKPSKPLEKLSLSLTGPQNKKILMPKRPASASRGRPSALALAGANLSSSNGKPSQKSLSPVKRRGPNSASVRKMVSKSRGHGNSEDEVNPVLMGTKMVERVVNMRKLAPPKLDDSLSNDNSVKKSSQFGRSLSKKSLDMAIRHMDIRGSIHENIRPIAQSSSAKSTVCVSESSMASCSDSSESSSISINDSRFLNRIEVSLNR